MTAYDVYKNYVALKNHFNTKSYDYFKYQGKTRTATIDAFNQRKDKIFFMKLAKHKDPTNFLVANLVRRDKTWIGDLAYNEEADRNYVEWLRTTQSLSYIFKNEIDHLKDDFDDNFKCVDNQHPFAMKLYFRKKISIETLIVLIDVVRCFSHWQKNLKDDVVWQELSHKIIKYKPFLHYDRSKMKNILLDNFKNR